ncbi:MAG TPA: RseA family anti-sigma factor [Lysobacter sp.]|nr:RseA family anti-sigma factor [Lysobacter sp.]
MSTSPFRPSTPETGDHETLSALVDGELHGDASRFALRRLGHDAGWRNTAARWQLIGDVLRGNSVAIAPDGFADRVAARLSADGATRPRRRVWHWAGGGALAASLALVAWFGLERSTPRADVAAPLATAPRTSAPATTPAASAPSAAPSAAPAAVSPERALAAQAPSRSGSRPAAGRPPQRRAAPARREPAMLADATREAASDNPFNAPPVEPAARPWPRSALPALAPGGAMNARFNEPSPYYPFEPRLPEEPTAPASRR